MSSKKLNDLRERLEKAVAKRDEFTESIKKLRIQIAEEESKEFRSVIDVEDVPFDEALKMLKQAIRTQKQQTALPSPEKEETKITQQGDNHATI